jgi:DNA modification methylase
MTYDELISKKLKLAESVGFEPIEPLNKHLFDWQRDCVAWAVRQGRCALFLDCGLGKTLQQLEWARQVSLHTKKPVLILCPLAVTKQTVREGKKFGIEVNACEFHDDVKEGINITNYEKLEHFHSHAFSGIVLDESSILKSFQGKTKQLLCDSFANTPYKLACTATPSPNDFMELGNHCEFLSIMPQSVMLATWFINDTATPGTWRLKKHAVKSFWQWVASWAICMGKPSDIGYKDDGYILPELKMIQHNVTVDYTIDSGEELFRHATLSATTMHKEMRITAESRAKKAAELMKACGDEACIIWCNTNYEADLLKELLPDSLEVRGSDTAKQKEEKLDSFTMGEKKGMITKASLAGYGLNWQHCHNVIFVGLSYSFEDLYQAVRRSWRFGQKHAVNCHIICAESEGAILKSINEKMQAHEHMRLMMKQTAITTLKTEKRKLKMNKEVKKAIADKWTMHHGDCVRVMEEIKDNSIDFSVFSPPFANLFTYSDDIQDMGNCENEDEFIVQFDYLVKHLYRTIKPGRLCAVHCCDLLATKWKDGNIELKNFSGMIIDSFRDHGWLYHCRVTIWKDPVVEMQRTKSLGLLHKQLLKDSAMSRVGSAEYMLIFRKPGKNDNPITHDRSEYPVELWQKDASPVWMDVNQTRVLNGKQARDNADERHICPLQLDVIERCLRLWTNKNDLVLSPFAGIGSEGYCALKMKRRFLGIELKESYFNQALKNLKDAEEESRSLFD